MMVLNRQQVRRLAVEPAGAGQGLALGAVAVAAGVVGHPLVAAVEAALDMPAQYGGAAGGQVAQGLALRGREHAPVAVEERTAVFPNHIRHFQRRPLQGGGHAGPSAFGAAGTALSRGSTSRSSKLGVWCRRCVLTCR
jgi:hypothetical protein